MDDSRDESAIRPARSPVTEDLTEAQLRAAWHDRRRSGWPHTYELSMRSPFLARIIAMHARHGMCQVNNDRRASEWLPTKLPADYTEAYPPNTKPGELSPMCRVFIDNKSRAAGEREDSDDADQKEP